MSRRTDDRRGMMPWLMILFLLAPSLSAQYELEDEGDSVVAADSSSTVEGFGVPDTAAALVRYDSSDVVPRLPSEASLQTLRNDDELQYDIEGHTPETMWDRITSWIGSLFGEAFANPAVVEVIEWIFYICAGLVLLFAIWKLINTDHSGLLARESAAFSGSGVVIEDIHAVDFDRLVDEAIRGRDFRGAVRLLYLKGLRRLSERNLIEWRRDRMNHDYLRQLGRSELADPFARCTLLFEYVWYGDFPLDEATFGSIAGTLRAFISRVEGGR